MKNILYLSGLLIILISTSCKEKCCDGKKDQLLKGEYFGQKKPGNEVSLFAPHIISTDMYERDMTISPDGKEIFYTVMGQKYSYIIHTQIKDGVWTKPEIASFSGDSLVLDAEPHISPDGNFLYYLSTRPMGNLDREPGWFYQNIWMVKKTDGKWGKPFEVGTPVNSDMPAYYPSMAKNGNFYFVRGNEKSGESYVYKSEFKNGEFSEPVKLPKEVNATQMQYNACISPDDSYIILCTSLKDDRIGKTDYCISFQDEEGNWTPLMNLGPKINSKGFNAISPYITPDGKYFFFASQKRKKQEFHNKTLDELVEIRRSPQNGNSDIYWISTEFIEELRIKAFSK